MARSSAPSQDASAGLPAKPSGQPDEADGAADVEGRAPSGEADQRGQGQAADRRTEIRSAVENGGEQRALAGWHPLPNHLPGGGIGRGLAGAHQHAGGE